MLPMANVANIMMSVVTFFDWPAVVSEAAQRLRTDIAGHQRPEKVTTNNDKVGEICISIEAYANLQNAISMPGAFCGVTLTVSRTMVPASATTMGQRGAALRTYA